MTSLSSILAGVYDYVGRPTQDKLSLGLVLPLLMDTISYYAVDLQISGENWLLKSRIWTPVSKDELMVDITDFSVPVAVEMREEASTDESDWQGILIANVTDVQDIGREGRRAVAFYGNPTRIKWSINPDDVAFEAKLWYEPLATEPESLTESPQISQAFHAMLKLRTALACLPFIGGPEIEAMATSMVANLGQWETKWRQWINVDRNARPVIKRDFRGARKGSQWL